MFKTMGSVVCGTTQRVFDRDILPKLKLKKKSKKGKTYCFVPLEMMKPRL